MDFLDKIKEKFDESAKYKKDNDTPAGNFLPATF